MKNNAQVKFVRIRGRVVPIRQQIDNHENSAKKNLGVQVITFGAGAAISKKSRIKGGLYKIKASRFSEAAKRHQAVGEIYAQGAKELSRLTSKKDLFHLKRAEKHINFSKKLTSAASKSKYLSSLFKLAPTALVSVSIYAGLKSITHSLEANKLKNKVIGK